jgi:GntR family transcriptional regulator, transcriptional repressor for pyruvate dehydrogenase complex
MAQGRRTIQPIRRLKLSDSVAAQLERMILEGSYAVDERLPSERALAEQFGVGRSTMREALRIVESAGLVRIEHGIGVFVASDTKRAPGLSADSLVVDGYTIPELFEVRLAIEREAAGIAAKRITPAEASKLEAILIRADDPELSNAGFIELDAQLHRSIVHATKNKLMIRVFASIEPLFVAYSHRVIELEGRRRVAHTGHQRIVDAVVSRHSREARDGIVAHLRDVERDIVEQVTHAEDRSTRA